MKVTATLAIFGLLAAALPLAAENPYIALDSDKSVTTEWAGHEWGDAVESTTDEGRPIIAKPELSEISFMEATGEWYQEWKWPSEGLLLGMISESKDGKQEIGSISLKSPSKLRTRRWIAIGNNEAEAAKAYHDSISKEDTVSGESLVIGSVYGGLIFGIDKGKVQSIFLGAAAE